MATDTRLHRWLEQWETRCKSDPALTAAEFLDVLGEDVPEALLGELQCAIADLDWIEEIMRKVKEKPGRASRFPDALGPHLSG